MTALQLHLRHILPSLLSQALPTPHIKTVLPALAEPGFPQIRSVGRAEVEKGGGEDCGDGVFGRAEAGV